MDQNTVEQELHTIVEQANLEFLMSQWKAAFKLYKKAEQYLMVNESIRAGHVFFRLVMYERNYGVPCNSLTASEYFDIAFKKLQPVANAGHPESLCSLGYMYEFGYGCTEDKTKAFKFYQLAADQGFPRGQVSTGFMYNNGHGIPVDKVKGAQYYKIAADQGFPMAQSNMGYMFERGYGVPRDLAMASTYYKLAAEQGYPRALYCLGNMYIKGRGVEHDNTIAQKYFTLAAERGHDGAQHILAKYYLEGKPWKRDIKKATKYFFQVQEQRDVMGVDASFEIHYLHGMFTGDYGSDVQALAKEYLSDEWPSTHKWLDSFCKSTILVVNLVLRELNILPELTVLILKAIVIMWPNEPVILIK